MAKRVLLAATTVLYARVLTGRCLVCMSKTIYAGQPLKKSNIALKALATYQLILLLIVWFIIIFLAVRGPLFAQQNTLNSNVQLNPREYNKPRELRS